LGLRLQLVEARSASDLDSGFAAMTRESAGAIYYTGSTMLFAQRFRIGELAAKNRLPMMCGSREYVEAGCLMGYAASFADSFRRAATYVDKILKGAKPGDLPIEQPTKLELVVNAKVARKVGVTIPPSILLRADHVIE